MNMLEEQQLARVSQVWLTEYSHVIRREDESEFQVQTHQGNEDWCETWKDASRRDDNCVAEREWYNEQAEGRKKVSEQLPASPDDGTSQWQRRTSSTDRWCVFQSRASWRHHTVGLSCRRHWECSEQHSGWGRLLWGTPAPPATRSPQSTCGRSLPRAR